MFLSDKTGQKKNKTKTGSLPKHSVVNSIKLKEEVKTKKKKTCSDSYLFVTAAQ